MRPETPPELSAVSGLARCPDARFHLQGWIGERLDGVTGQWLRVAPLANPAMLEMFRDRDRTPRRDLVPWAGEFAGKYLTGAVEVLRLTGDAGLRSVLEEFVRELLALQDDDGYLGPWPRAHRLTGWAPNAGRNGGATWDAWGHYHILLGLLHWHEEAGDPSGLAAAERIGDRFCDQFLGRTPRLVDTGSTEMNLAPLHGLCLLYRRTGRERYLALARQLVEELAARDADGNPLAGDYLNTALAGREFYQGPKPRWESLHPIMGLAELYGITGDERYRRAFEQIWTSIQRLDRHNNGGFSSGEQAQGNPYHPGAIETCCTIAWMALSVEMLRLTGDSRVADELELSLLNSVVGMHSPTGRWATYNTPMDGVRKASAHDIVFQSREGSPELNCCSVNSARGFGLLSEWAVLRHAEGLALNWYGPGAITATLAGGETVTLRQETGYPRTGHVQLTLHRERAAEFTLRLRIPHWSRESEVRVNGAAVPAGQPGRYLALRREWRTGDRVDLHLDLRPHLWVGEQECAGLASLYRGPLLLAYDRRFNRCDPYAVPTLDAR
ncbi:MAG: hypothetical protein FJX77_13715, partial [Armatimonadetes bacterium]|nr:hypothetical protein [Armatimonadota bacterium]